MTLPNSDNVTYVWNVTARYIFAGWYDLGSNTILFDNSNYESE